MLRCPRMHWLLSLPTEHVMSRREAKSSSHRQLRVGEEMRHALAWVFERGEVHDPGLAGISLTVTEVRVSQDLRYAAVYVLPLGGGDVQAMLAALERARPFLRHRVGQMVRLKFVPELSFKADDSFERAQRIEALLHEPRLARDAEHFSEEDGDGT